MTKAWHTLIYIQPQNQVNQNDCLFIETNIFIHVETKYFMDQHLICACDGISSPVYKGGPLTKYLINYIQWLNDSSLKTFSSFFLQTYLT